MGKTQYEWAFTLKTRRARRTFDQCLTCGAIVEHEDRELHHNFHAAREVGSPE